MTRIEIEEYRLGKKLKASLYDGRTYVGCFAADRIVREDIAGKFCIQNWECDAVLWADEVVVLLPGFTLEYIGEDCGPRYEIVPREASE